MIQTEEEYQVLLARISTLMDATSGPRGAELCVLARVVEAYEKEHYPILPHEIERARRLTPLEKELEIKAFVDRPEIIEESLALLKVSLDKGAGAAKGMRWVILSALLRFHGIPLRTDAEKN